MSTADDAAAIEELLHALRTADPADPVATGAALARLLASRHDRDTDELRRAARRTTALRQAIDQVRRAQDADQIVALLCPVVGALAGTAEVRFVPADTVAAPPITEPAGQAGPARTQPPATVFPLIVDGAPAGQLRVAAAVDTATAAAIEVFLTSAGSAVEAAGLRRRRARQRELFDEVAAGWHPEALGPAPSAPPPADLTEREAEVFAVLITGATNADISRELSISVETVRSHVKRILHKCGVANRAELIGRSRPG